MILLLSRVAFAELCPDPQAAEFVSWSRPSLFEWGEWSSAGGQLQLRQPEPQGKWSVWIPQQSARADARYHLRVQPGESSHFALLARMSLEDRGTDDLSGYGLGLEKNQLILYRWDRGEMRPLMPPVDFRPQAEVDLIFELSGDALTGYVCDPQSHGQLAKINAIDSAHSTGHWGIRQHPKQGKDTVLGQMSISPQSTTPTLNGWDIFGIEVLIQIDSTASLPSGFETYKLDHPPYPGQWLLLPDRTQLSLLEASGLKVSYATGRIPYWVRNSAYRTSPPKPQARSDGNGFVLDQSYKDPRMVADLLKAYHTQYPDITELHTLGNSRQGRPIWALRITDNPQKDEIEPTVLMVAAHHGSELLSTEYALDSINEILRGAEGTNPDWISELDIWVVPLVNPDGNACLWGIDENFGRKNCWDLNGDGQIEATEGVDLNRNYPLAWGALGEKGSRSWLHSNYYRGPEAASEPETQTIMMWAQSYQPAVVMSWHTMGNMILSPYTIDGLTPLQPDIPWAIAEQLLDGIPAPPGRKTPPRLRRKMYGVDGVDQDWHLHNHGAMAYIIEGSHHNPLDMNLRNASVELYRPIRNRLLDHLATGPAIRIQVLDPNGYPIRAKVSIEGLNLMNGEEWHTRYHDGRWDFLVPAHTDYTVRIEAEGYKTQRVKVHTTELKQIKLRL